MDSWKKWLTEIIRIVYVLYEIIINNFNHKKCDFPLLLKKPWIGLAQEFKLPNALQVDS